MKTNPYHRTYVIGDIHGYAHLLEEIINKIEYSYIKGDRIVFLGGEKMIIKRLKELFTSFMVLMMIVFVVLLILILPIRLIMTFYNNYLN